MKRLFLTSAASNVLDKFVELLERPTSDLTVAFVPTAWDVYEDKYFVDKDRNKLIQLWFKVIDINITGKTQKILEKQFQNIDIIFVAGGNTFYLLEKTLASGFDKIIKKHVKDGKYYIGSSAGSILVGLSIEPFKFLDDQSKWSNLKSFDGLKLIDKIILPHYGKEKYKEKINQILKNYSYLKDKIIKLTDDQALLVDNENFKIISK